MPIPKELKTRFKDGRGKPIYYGDVLHVEDKATRLDFEGVIECIEGKACVSYRDQDGCETFPISFFKKADRRLLTQEQRREYWKGRLLGDEPPRYLYIRGEYAKGLGPDDPESYLSV